MALPKGGKYNHPAIYPMNVTKGKKKMTQQAQYLIDILNSSLYSEEEEIKSAFKSATFADLKAVKSTLQKSSVGDSYSAMLARANMRAFDRVMAVL